VRSDLVEVRGTCDGLRVVEELPTVPVGETVNTANLPTDTVCAGNVFRARAGDIIRIDDMVPDPNVPGEAVISTFYAGRTVFFKGPGTQTGSGVAWSLTWVATPGAHNLSVTHTPTMQIHPTWSENPIGAGEAWSHPLCEVHVSEE
jgi:hypothetical protein